jgi:hypothetical protein
MNKTTKKLLLQYVKSCALKRNVEIIHAKIRDRLVVRLDKAPEVHAGWRARRFWRKTYRGTVEVYRPAHWELDIRRNTKPLSSASKP